ncbi:hypothetical protein ILUMI_17864 [Ignelater luminosus]|uniref:Uncharacterized protein n=1 Tax=Ignelater luminosus TaxID=2038154 RepID=A0A8K0CJ41_IGNLU|nr:hypothetical protein ILUMI_17864 [Ignelater luminosus]
MNVCVLLLLLVAHQALAHQNVTLSDIRKLWRRTMSPVQSECMCKTGVTQRVLDKFFKYGNMPDDPCFGCFMNCVNLKLGIMNSAGEIDAKILSEVVDYVDISLAQKCVNKTGEPDRCRKAFLLFQCVYDDLSKQFPA